MSMSHDNFRPQYVKRPSEDLSLAQLLRTDSVDFRPHDSAPVANVSAEIERFTLDHFQSYFSQEDPAWSSCRNQVKHFLQPRRSFEIPEVQNPRPRVRPLPKLPSVDLEGDPQDVQKDLAVEQWWKRKRQQIREETAVKKYNSQRELQTRWMTEKHGRRRIIVFENLTPADMINEALGIISSLDPDGERSPSRLVILLAELERVRRIHQESIELKNDLEKRRSQTTVSKVWHRYAWNQPHLPRPMRTPLRPIRLRAPKLKLRLSWNHVIYVQSVHQKAVRTRPHSSCLVDRADKELTFTPTISRPPRGYRPKLEIWSRLYNHARQMLKRRLDAQEKRQKQLEVQEIDGCTFTPSLPSSPRRGNSDSDVVRRLYTMDLEKRKASWTELLRRTSQEISSNRTYKHQVSRPGSNPMSPEVISSKAPGRFTSNRH